MNQVNYVEVIDSNVVFQRMLFDFFLGGMPIRFVLGSNSFGVNDTQCSFKGLCMFCLEKKSGYVYFGYCEQDCYIM